MVKYNLKALISEKEFNEKKELPMRISRKKQASHGQRCQSYPQRRAMRQALIF